MFAQDATEYLCNHKDIQREEYASFTLTADSNASEEIGDAAQGAGETLVVLSPRPGLDYPGLDAAQHNVMMRSDGDSSLTVHDTTLFKDPDFENEDYPLHTSRQCTQIIEIQQMSCALAKDVLDYPNLKPTWSWNGTGKSHTRESGRDFTAKEGSYSTVDTGTYLQKSPEDEGEEDPQEHISRHHDIEGDSGQAINGDGSKATSSIEVVTEESPTPTSSSLKAQQSYGTESAASQKDHSIPRRATLSTPQRSYVSPSQDIPPSSPSPSLVSSKEELSEPEDLPSQKSAEERKALEDAEYARLENLPIDLKKARDEKESAKKKAAEEAARAAAEAWKRGDEDKLAKLERLILAQKDEQLKREAAAEAVRAAEKAEADAEAAKIATEKKASAEKAKLLLDAAKQAREAAEEKAAIELAQKTSAPILFQDPIGRKFSCPWHLCSTREVHTPCPSLDKIPQLIHVGNGRVHCTDQFRRSSHLPTGQQWRVRSDER
jgi:hypothetical protein